MGLELVYLFNVTENIRVDEVEAACVELQKLSGVGFVELRERVWSSSDESQRFEVVICVQNNRKVANIMEVIQQRHEAYMLNLQVWRLRATRLVPPLDSD